MPLDNVTARAARWSASHRTAAILGWFALVLIAFAVGNAAGVVNMKDEEFGIGDSHAPERVLATEFPSDRAAEQVLLQGRAGRRDRPDPPAAVGELPSGLERLPGV